MSASPRILSLDLGSQSVGLAEFRAQPNGGLVLTGYRRATSWLIPLAETDRNRQISETLSAMMRELADQERSDQLRGLGQSVFARFVKLPSVEQDKIERIVTFEAQQNVPFPIEEVVWDYQLVGSSEADKIEVVLVAIKADLLDGINAAVEATGLQTRLVDVATMALYNAFRYNYSELTDCFACSSISARARPICFSSSREKFSAAAFRLAAVRSPRRSRRNSTSPLARLSCARSMMDSLVWAAPYAETSDPDVARVVEAGAQHDDATARGADALD